MATAKSQFVEMVNGLVAKGFDRARAVRQVSMDNPGLRERMIEEGTKMKFYIQAERNRNSLSKPKTLPTHSKSLCDYHAAQTTPDAEGDIELASIPIEPWFRWHFGINQFSTYALTGPIIEGLSEEFQAIVRRIIFARFGKAALCFRPKDPSMTCFPRRSHASAIEGIESLKEVCEQKDRILALAVVKIES